MIKKLLVIAGGIGLGVAAMYFLDPRYGRRRRDQWTEHLSDTAEDAQEAAAKVIAEVKSDVKEFLKEAEKKLNKALS